MRSVHIIVCYLFFLNITSFSQILISYETPVKPQGSDAVLAMEYFEKKEFEKANFYFEKIFPGNPNQWYNNYFKSLLEVKDFSMAEKITKQQLKADKNRVVFYINLGKIHRQKEEPKREKECYEKAIKDLPVLTQYITELANAFNEEKMYDYALSVYNKARTFPPNYPYYYEKAEVYKMKNDLTSMVNEYLDALEYRESELLNVESNLQNSLGYDDENGGIKNPILKNELLKRIQKDPDKTVFAEFLIFILKQQKDFNGAFIQCKALDKKQKEQGYRIFELAKLCMDNQDWDCANRCYEYLMEKGNSTVYFEYAQVESLHLEFIILTSSAININQLVALEQKLDAAYAKYKGSANGINLLKDLANLKAFYLNKPQDAIQLLEEFIKSGGTDKLIVAEFKILLGDIYLVSDNVWDASLLYAQVEKDFKYAAIGEEAKFKNAKLSFYSGDFKWAKAQCDVLKGATSKLISNDALELSLIISDALGVDTNDVPLMFYSRADWMILQHRYNEALARMDSVNLLFSHHTLVDDIYFKKAEVFTLLGKYSDAEAMYKNILEFFPEELYGDDARYKLAQLYEKYLHDNEKAKQAWQDLMTKYPGSIYTSEARKKFRELRGDNLKN